MKSKFIYLAGAAFAGAAVFYLYSGLLGNSALGITKDEVVSFQLPFYEGHGRVCQDLAWDGDYLWVIDSDMHGGDVPEILKIEYDEGSGEGSIVSSFQLPGTGDDKRLHKGLTWDGTYLLTAWGGYPKSRIYQIEPSNPGGATYFEVDKPLIYGLAFEAGAGMTDYLWTVIASDNYICKLDREDGAVMSSFNTTPQLGDNRKPAGLGFDGQYIWLAAFGKADSLFAYTTAGSFVGSVDAETDKPHAVGVTYDVSGDYLWYVDACTDTFYRIKLLYE